LVKQIGLLVINGIVTSKRVFAGCVNEEKRRYLFQEGSLAFIQ
jgi:hypothetical protein